MKMYLKIIFLVILQPILFAGELTLIALDDVTVIVDSDNGKRIYSGILREGETHDIGEITGARIKFSRGSALEIEFDGQTLRPDQVAMGVAEVGMGALTSKFVPVRSEPVETPVGQSQANSYRRLSSLQMDVRIESLSEEDRLQEISQTIKTLFDSLVSVGFTEDQALQIVCSQQIF